MHVPYEGNPLGLPWHLDEESASGTVVGCRTIEDCYGLPITNTHGLADDNEDRDIAEYVIKATAHYQSLVDTLREIRQYAGYSGVIADMCYSVLHEAGEE